MMKLDENLPMLKLYSIFSNSLWWQLLSSICVAPREQYKYTHLTATNLTKSSLPQPEITSPDLT